MRLLQWLADVYRTYLGNEWYEAKVDLPIEEVWRHFHEVVANSKRPDFWNIRENITGQLFGDYQFKLVGIVQTGGVMVNLRTVIPPCWIQGLLSAEGLNRTLIRYKVALGPSLRLLAFLSLPIGILLPIFAFPESLGVEPIISFILMLGVGWLIPIIQFGLAQQQKQDINRNFQTAFRIRATQLERQ